MTRIFPEKLVISWIQPSMENNLQNVGLYLRILQKKNRRKDPIKILMRIMFNCILFLSLIIILFNSRTSYKCNHLSFLSIFSLINSSESCTATWSRQFNKCILSFFMLEIFSLTLLPPSNGWKIKVERTEKRTRCLRNMSNLTWALLIITENGEGYSNFI